MAESSQVGRRPVDSTVDEMPSIFAKRAQSIGDSTTMLRIGAMGDEHWIANQLVQTGKWSFDHALAAVRADFKCEYCGLNLLTDAQHYKLWQLDHIVPRKLMMQAGRDPEDLDNLAIACKPCNFDFKWRFDPRAAAGAKADRAALIKAAKAEIERRKQVCDDELARVREIIGRGPD